MLSGTGRVELTVQCRAGSVQHLFHLINYAGQDGTRYEEPNAVHGLRLGIRGTIEGEARALIADVTIAPEAGPDKNGYIWFSLPPLEVFEAISLRCHLLDQAR